jgi:hypothetical protein
VKNELERMWKEAVVVYFEVLFICLNGLRKTTEDSVRRACLWPRCEHGNFENGALVLTGSNKGRVNDDSKHKPP